MSDVKITMAASVTATLKLNEGQLRALDALVGYGDDAFLKAFYVKLGKHYMQPFEADLRSLFREIRREVPGALAQIEEIRSAHNLPRSSGEWIKRTEKLGTENG